MTAPISIALIGDIFPGQEGELVVHDDVISILVDADLVIGNLESPLTTGSDPSVTKTVLQAPPETATLLGRWGVDVVTLANNHLLDCGRVGLEETIAELDRLGVEHLGAGVDLESARRPLTVTVGEQSIGIVAASWERIQTQIATASEYGAAPLSADEMIDQVRSLKTTCDTVIVLPHWGYTGYTIPLPEHLDLAHRLVEAGASIVAGSHPHVLQGAIEAGGGVLAMSLGNFAFGDFITADGTPSTDATLPAGYREAGILVVEMGGSSPPRLRWHFTRQRRGHVTLDLRGRRSRTQAARSRALLGGRYDQRWKSYVRRRLLRRVIHWLHPRRWTRIRAGTLRGGILMARSGKP